MTPFGEVFFTLFFFFAQCLGNLHFLDVSVGLINATSEILEIDKLVKSWGFLFLLWESCVPLSPQAFDKVHNDPSFLGQETGC